MFKGKLIISAIAAAVLTAGTGTAVYAYYNNGSSSGIAVPDFVGADKATVENWIEKYDTEEQVQLVYDYSEEVEVDIVMDQSLEEGSVLEADETLQLTLSLGPDDEAVFELPDFTGKKKTEIEEWFNKYHFTAVTYTYEAVEDASIEKDTFISMTPEAGNEVLRTDAIEVKLVTDEITVPDLAAMSREDIQAWGDKWGVTISFEEQESEMLQDGTIASVSAANGAIVKRGDTIVVKIAKHVDRPTDQAAKDYEDNAKKNDERHEDGAGSNNKPITTPQPTPTPSPTNLCPSPSEVPQFSRPGNVDQVLGTFSEITDKGCVINYDLTENRNESTGYVKYSYRIDSADGNSARITINYWE